MAAQPGDTQQKARERRARQRTLPAPRAKKVEEDQRGQNSPVYHVEPGDRSDETAEREGATGDD